MADGRPCRIAVCDWPRLVAASFFLSGRCCARRCDVCRWTSSTSFGLETPSLRRRRSNRRRDPACLSWSNVRSSLSVSGRDWTKIPKQVHVSRFTYDSFYIFPFHVFPPRQFCCLAWQVSLRFAWTAYLFAELS